MSEFIAPRRAGLVWALLACLVVALGGLVTTSASAGGSPTAPVAIVIDQIHGETLTGLGTLPLGAQPGIFVQAGDTFSIDVSFHDATGATVPFNNDVTLAISGTTNSGAATLDPPTVVVPKGNSTYTLETSIADAANQVVLTVAVAGKKPSTVASGVSYLAGVKDLRFDVVADARTAGGGSGFQEGIGGDTNCTNATKDAPVCAIVLLPRGAGAGVLLSVGACDTTAGSTYAPCFVGPRKTGGAILQTLFAQPGVLPYTADSPATVVVKCDKTLCGTGSIQSMTLAFSFSGSGNLTDAQACPAKGVAIAAVTDADGNVIVPAQACVDYVQSKRDGSGDTHFFLNTPGDLRVGMG